MDSSVLIDYFNVILNRETDILDECLLKGRVILGDIVAMEVYQGFRLKYERDIAKELFDGLIKHEMLGFSNCLAYADFYRKLRENGFTIRKSNDVVIAGYCILNNLPLLQRDRDFKPFEKHFGLQLI